jgi:hypothetical protein
VNVTEILTSARKAVEDAGLQGELVPIGFTKAIDLLAGAALPGATPQASIPPQIPGPQVGDEQGPKERLAAKLDVAVETVDSIFYLPDGEVEIVAAPSRLESSAAKATKQIALLTVAARSEVLGEEWVSVEYVRRWCEHYKRYDQSNFSAHLKGMDKIFGMRGTSRKRELRMSAVAWSEATALAREIGGES